MKNKNCITCSYKLIIYSFCNDEVFLNILQEYINSIMTFLYPWIYPILIVLSLWGDSIHIKFITPIIIWTVSWYFIVIPWDNTECYDLVFFRWIIALKEESEHVCQEVHLRKPYKDVLEKSHIKKEMGLCQQIRF